MKTSSELIDFVNQSTLIPPLISSGVSNDGVPYMYVGFTTQVLVENLIDKNKEAVFDVVNGPLAKSPVSSLRYVLLHERIPFTASFIRHVDFPDHPVIDFNKDFNGVIQKHVDACLKDIDNLDLEKIIDRVFHKTNPVYKICFAFVIFGEEGQLLEEHIDLKTNRLLHWPEDAHVSVIRKVVVPDENGNVKEVEPSLYYKKNTDHQSAS